MLAVADLPDYQGRAAEANGFLASFKEGIGHERGPETGESISGPTSSITRLIPVLGYDAKISMVSPSAMVTMAFFQERV